ncbi:MAG: hypothetical protein PWP64_1703, partial [Candidatus Cloacimonadota bacterium]|nr:hypothetical protein [Candidatus Cloacimonadota bacterium]
MYVIQGGIMKKLLFVFTLSLLMIGMAWGQTVILENDCSTEPEGWELSDAGGQPVYKGSYWLLDTNEDYIISEAIDVADYILLTLSFDVATYGTGTANAALVEYSMDNGTSWEATTFITETPNSSSYIPSGDWLLGELNTTQLKFRWTRPAESGRGVRIKNILLTGIDPSGSPVLNTSVTELIDLDYFEGEGPSAAQSFMLSGVNLTSDVTVTATTSFEIKTDSMLNFGDTITLSPVDGIVAETAIYVRLIAGLSITSYEGTIYITSPGAEDKSIALYGSVNEPPLPADNIFFSEYIEGGSNNKALEIYNPSDEDVDLSNYKMVLYSNGASDPGNTLTMEGMLTPGAVYVTANSSSNQTILDVANSTSTVTYFNGDDAIALVYIPGDEIIDVIGVIGTQTKWDVAGITNATENHTLVRKPTVSQGNTDWSAAAGTNTEDSEWLVFPQDTFNYLGSHTFGEQITETPVISPAEGLNYTPIMVTISTTTPNAEIRYTTDGNIPSETEGTIYTNPFEINTTTTVKAIAYADGYSPSLIASATYYFPVAVADIAALRNGATDGTVYQLEGEAILTFQQSNRNQKYIQDGTAAILIDDAPGNITTSYNDYDGITGIYGTLNFYYGMLQFLPIADPGPATSSGNTVTPELRTLASLTSDDQAKLVKLENVSFVETGTFGNYAANYDIVQDGVTYTLRTFPDTDMSGESIPENTLDIIALVGQYNATMQVSPRSMADMQAVANYPEGDPIPVGENTITFTQGSANEGPVVEELPGWNNSNLDP